VQTDLTFAAILTLAVIGVVLFWLIGVVERLVAPWQAGGGHGASTARRPGLWGGALYPPGPARSGKPDLPHGRRADRGARRRFHRRRRGRVRGHRRPERLRQEHPAADRARHRPGHAGAGPLARDADHRAAARRRDGLSDPRAHALALGPAQRPAAD